MQCVGQHVKAGDIKINVCKTKALTNMRASGSDKKVHGQPLVYLRNWKCSLSKKLRRGMFLLIPRAKKSHPSKSVGACCFAELIMG